MRFWHKRHFFRKIIETERKKMTDTRRLKSRQRGWGYKACIPEDVQIEWYKNEFKNAIDRYHLAFYFLLEYDINLKEPYLTIFQNLNYEFKNDPDELKKIEGIMIKVCGLKEKK